MRVAIFNAGTRQVTIEDVSMPAPRSGEIVIKIHRCGICGSDISMTSDASFSLKTGPFGHEYAGEVVDIGAGVESVRTGDRVTVVPVVPCGTCEYCRRFGNPMLCSNSQRALQGFGEYAVVPAGVAVSLPASLSFADGALVEPMACGLHAMRLAGCGPGKRVLVLGGGAMALSAIYWARRTGADRVVVLSRSAHRAEMIMAVGGDAIVGFDPDDHVRLTECLGGAPDIVAECVGKQGMLDLALTHVRPAGTILSMGMCMHRESIIPAQATSKEARMMFPLGYTMEEFAATARALDVDRLRPERMVGEVISLEQLPAMLDAMRAGKGGAKVQVDPGASGTLD